MDATQSRDSEVIRAGGGLVWRDSPQGRELAVVHRERYNDWTLPKGKLQEGESWLEAALREVKEEVGCDVQVGSFAGSICYTVGDKPKIVRFWHMEIRGEPSAQRDAEVDKVAWLTVEEARARLQYP